MQKFRLEAPFHGLNTRRPALLLDTGECQDCLNAVLDSGGIGRRYGSKKIGGQRSGRFSLSDDFDRGNNASLGANWTETESAGGTVAISSLKVLYAGTGATSYAIARPAGLATVVGAGAYQQVKIVGGGNTEDFAMLCVGQDSDGYPYYVSICNQLYTLGSVQYNGVTLWKSDGSGPKGGVTSVIATSTTDYDGASVLPNTGTSSYKTYASVTHGRMVSVYCDTKLVLTADVGAALIVSGAPSFGFGAAGDTGWSFNDYKVIEYMGPTGAYTFADANGARYNLVKQSNDLYKVVDEDDNATVGLNGLSYGTQACFATFSNRAYIADGTNPGKATDGSSVFNAHIAAPTAAPTATAGSGTGLTGEMSWRYSHYSSTWGIESPPSAASTGLLVNNKDAYLTLSSSGDSRVDQMRIYRRDNSAGETRWTLVTTATSATSATDATHNNLRDKNTFVTNLTTPSWQPFTVVAVHNNRMYWAYGSTVYFSDLNRPGNLAGYQVLEGGDHDPVTAMVSLRGVLIVFQRRGITLHSGVTTDEFLWDKVINGIGAIGHASTVVAGDMVYFAGLNSIYRWSGVGMPEEIGYNIQPTWAARNTGADSLCNAVYDPARGTVSFSYWTRDALYFNNMLVYFTEYSRRAGRHCWSQWKGEYDAHTDNTFVSFGSYWAPSCQAIMTPQRGMNSETWWGMHYGAMNLYGYNNYHADAQDQYDADSSVMGVDMTWTTGKLDFGEFDTAKSIGNAYADWVKDAAAASAHTIRLSYAKEDNTSYTNCTTADAATTASHITGRISGNARNIALKATCTAIDALTAQPITLLKLSVEVALTGKDE